MQKIYAEVILVQPGDDWLALTNSAKAGDIVEFSPGQYSSKGYPYNQQRITISGTAANPITIRSKVKRAAVLSGDGGKLIIQIKNSNHLIVEDFTFTNPSPYGIDGREEYRWPPNKNLSQGLVVYGTYNNITIRNNVFKEIATRGIFVNCTGTCSGLKIERNLFTHVGHDTAGGDISISGSPTAVVIRENLLAGNVDGAVFAGNAASVGGHILERNICLNGKREDCFDFKAVNYKGSGAISHVRDNVIYAEGNSFTGISIQNESNKIHAHGNYIKGNANVALMQIHGRSLWGPKTYDGVRDIEFFDNYLKDTTNHGFMANQPSSPTSRLEAAPIVNSSIYDNLLEDVGSNSPCCGVGYTHNNTNTSAVQRRPYELLEGNIWNNLCEDFSEQEILDTVEMSRAMYHGFDASALQGSCSNSTAPPLPTDYVPPCRL